MRFIAQDVIVCYLEPEMYLIVACLQFLRVFLRQLHNTLSESSASFLRLRLSVRPTASNSNLEASSDRESWSLGRRNLMPMVEVKLTGQGNLYSLARAGDDTIEPGID